MTLTPDPGDGWVYEHIVIAIPGVSVAPTQAIAMQFVGFEAVVLALAWVYDLPAAAVAGTAAVAVATAGSAAMVAIATTLRGADADRGYRRLLFGSNVEVVLGVLSYAALSTYLVVGADGVGSGFLQRVLGSEPPVPAVFVAFVLAWDVCYRIGVGWWASLVGCWRSLRTQYTASDVAAYRRADLLTVGFAAVQLVLVPVLVGEPLLSLAVVGHVAAVIVVSGVSLLALERRKISPPGSA
jgi:hypothetical protein